VTNDRKGLKELALSEALGLAYGAGIGLFVFLRPRLPSRSAHRRSPSRTFLAGGVRTLLSCRSASVRVFQGLRLGKVAEGQIRHPNATVLMPVPERGWALVEAIFLGAGGEHLAFMAKRNVH
jgi:hypothetical protein